MEIITERAASYAEGKTNEAITRAISQAYVDGYRDGYKDRENERPVDLRGNKTVFVDLGLPSGTLWSADYEKEDGNTIFLPYIDVTSFDLPSKAQWCELKSSCQWTFYQKESMKDNYFLCIGPNGNSIRFYLTGLKKASSRFEWKHAFFWIRNNELGKGKYAVNMYDEENIYGVYEIKGIVDLLFAGYKLPIRLIKSKKEK